MGKIRVLIVDDSAVIRKVLGDCLSADPDIEVVGTAANGKIALDKLSELKPDVVTLDIEMPEMNGLETVKHVRKEYPKLPIIMCSSLTAAGATHTLDALAFGASDYVTKPSSHGVNTREVVGEELIRKIKGWANPQKAKLAQTALPPLFSAHSAELSPFLHRKPDNASEHTIEVVAIGVSTGGPNALLEVLPHLPTNLRVPVLIVQHMPPLFTKLLADRLATQCHLQVVEAQDGEEIKAGTVYLAPGGLHMEVKKTSGRIATVLHEGPPENSCRPAVDVLFRSVAAVYGRGVLATVLTGMGQDGLFGAQRIKEMGGQIIAQDQESSAVWGMPGAVVEAGLTSAILPLSSIAREISRKVLQ